MFRWSFREAKEKVLGCKDTSTEEKERGGQMSEDTKETLAMLGLFFLMLTILILIADQKLTHSGIVGGEIDASDEFYSRGNPAFSFG